MNFIKKKLTQRVKLNLYKFIHFQKKQIKWDRFILKFVTYLTYSCPHEPISSLDPRSLNFRLSLPSLIVIPNTDMMSAQNLCYKKKKKTQKPLSVSNKSKQQKNWDNAILKWKVHLRGNS